MILILCYPSHGTHIYQGLDVVVFGVLKNYWTVERDRWEREKGEKISKINFLVVYGNAHLRALTPTIIKAAFRKTGVWPFNPLVVTEEMMAPSKETSCEGFLPIVPASPIKLVAKLLRDLTNKDHDDEIITGLPAPNSNAEDLPIPVDIPTLPAAVTETLKRLSNTSLAFLVSATPYSPETQIRHNVARPISPLGNRYADLLSIEPKTPNEYVLLDALRDAKARTEGLKRQVLELQAATVLNEMYCNMLRGQLAHQNKKKNTPKGAGKLVGDGLPRLLSGDEFYEKVVEHTERQKREEREKKEKQGARDERAEAMKEWKKQDDERKEENTAQTSRYHEALKVWEAEKALAKEEKRAFGKPRPKRGKLASALPKPSLNAPATESSDDEEESDSDLDR
jgi:hypothetical protein